MSEARKTAAIVALAIALAILVWVTAPRTVTPGAFQDRGTSFFPGFNDPRMAQSIEVVDFDADTATAHPFQVQSRDGTWTIPSYYDYPADNIERLGKTVASVIALRKDNVATENVSDEERTGTLDPLDETLPAIRGRGKRITIKGDNDRILADVIIGQTLPSRPQFRYVRLAGQSRVYVADAGELDISSKFTDWIDRDLLHIDWNEVDQAIIRDYSLDSATHGVNVRDTIFLRKLGEDEDHIVHWTIRDLRPGEQVNTFRANLLNTGVDEVSILGVRPKPASIAAGLLQTRGTLKVSKGDLADFENKGFHFTAKGDLVADKGELLVHTRTGLFFRLCFGAVAYGEPEDTGDRGIGAAAAAPDSAPKSSAAPGDKILAPRNAKAGVSALGTPNYYLLITASFDPTALPAGPARDEAQKQAAALQMRFAPWYYVISGQSFDRMHAHRQELVKAKDSKKD